MAVELTATDYSGVGTGSSATYATGIYANASDQIKVFVAGVLQTLGDEYSIDGLGAETGVDVIGDFAAGAPVYVERVTPVTQLVDTQNNETILEDVLDGALDKLTLIAQEIDGKARRALSFPRGEAGATIPAAAERANRFLAFDIDGNLVLSSGPGADGGLRTDLGEDSGATLVGSDDGAGGSLWNSIAGFVAFLRANLGASVIGFIQAGVGAVAETLLAAVRREVWADQFRMPADVGDGPSITRAVTALLAASGGGVVRLSRRPYTLAAPITFTGLNNVRLVGAGKSNDGTMLRESFANGSGITFSGCQSCEISDVYFWPTVRKTGGFSVRITGSSFSCAADIRSDFGWNALDIEGASETRYKLTSRYLLGTNGARYAGTSGSRSFRAICEDQISDNPYPIAPTPSSIKTFSPGMTLAAGDIFLANGAIWQCTVGGTAGASAPSGYPAGTTPESVFFTDVANGTATLRWIANAGLTHIAMDSWAYSFVIRSAAVLNGGRPFAMLDNANTGTSYPVWVDVQNLECDHGFSVGVDLSGGEGFYGHGFLWVGSTLAGNGILIGPNYRGDVSLGPGTRVYGNAQHGILRQAGPVDVRFVGVECCDNGVSAPATFHGLQIASGSVGTQIVGGNYGDSPSIGGNAQAFGISIGLNCDQTRIVGPNLRGNSTGPISIGATQVGLTYDSATYIPFRTIGTIGPAATGFLAEFGNTPTEGDAMWRAPRNGRIVGFYAATTVAAGAGQTFTYTVRRNNANTTLTGVSTGAASFNTDVWCGSSPIALAKGDTFAMQIATSATAGAARHNGALIFVPD